MCLPSKTKACCGLSCAGERLRLVGLIGRRAGAGRHGVAFSAPCTQRLVFRPVLVPAPFLPIRTGHKYFARCYAKCGFMRRELGFGEMGACGGNVSRCASGISRSRLGNQPYPDFAAFLIDTPAIRNALKPCICIADLRSNRHSSEGHAWPFVAACEVEGNGKCRTEERSIRATAGLPSTSPACSRQAQGKQDDDGSAGLTASFWSSRQRGRSYTVPWRNMPALGISSE
jgi:hypothetical protein